MTKNDVKRTILFNKPVYTLLSNEETGYRLDIELDLFNDNMLYVITNVKDRNKGELCLPSSGINEVIDRYFKLIGENNNVSFTI
jgi:hypothetical protein